MPTDTDLLDTLVSPVGDEPQNTTEFDIDATIEPTKPAWNEPGYEGKIDYRIRQLSYSSALTLHSCPRKFQLYKLRSKYKEPDSLKSTITLSYGDIVGMGIQKILEGESWERVAFQMFVSWRTDIMVEDTKLDKSLWSALHAVKMFQGMRDIILADYELVYFQGKPACELAFCIVMPNGFRYRGKVDAVLRERSTGKIRVLECKTTGFANVPPSMYKNSFQGIGYSIVLDYIVPEVSSYEVLYLVYKTKDREFLPIDFQKHRAQRAEWIQELLLMQQEIEMYENARHYPKRGESCFSFGRDCEYINTCHMSTDYLTNHCTEDEVDKTDYQFVISLEDLIASQLQLTEGVSNHAD